MANFFKLKVNTSSNNGIVVNIDLIEYVRMSTDVININFSSGSLNIIPKNVNDECLKEFIYCLENNK